MSILENIGVVLSVVGVAVSLLSIFVTYSGVKKRVNAELDYREKVVNQLIIHRKLSEKIKRYKTRANVLRAIEQNKSEVDEVMEGAANALSMDARIRVLKALKQSSKKGRDAYISKTLLNASDKANLTRVST